MDGIDGFVFTAGIGENAPRSALVIAARLALAWARARSRGERAPRPRDLADAIRRSRLVVPTDEELMIAQQTLALLRAPPCLWPTGE